ncbi:MAG: HAMP domain-containing protein, partial [Chromatiales bacterium]|nr:HAMP domain-containing protein [Chromatiales bacterium]
MSFTLLRNLGLGALLGLLFGVAYLSHMQVEHSVSLVHTLVRKDMPDRTALLNGRLYLSNARNHFDLFVRKDPIQAQDIQAQTDALEATILDLANTQGPSDTRLLALYNEVQSIKTGFRIYLQEENIDPSGDGATELTERLRSQVFSLRKRVNHSTQDLGATNSDSAEVWEAGERIRDLVVELSEAMTRYLGRERLSLEPVINLLDMAMERFQLPSREDLPPNLVGLWSQLIKKTTQCRALVRNFEQEMRHDPSQESFLENQDLIRRQWEDTEVTLQQVVDGFLAHVVAVHDSLLQSVETTRAKTHAIVLVGALLALVIAIALGRTLSLRLRTLAGATERLAQGELEYRLNVNTADDFGRLAASFNVMAERIQEDNTHLREAARAAREADAAKSRFLATMSHEIRTPMNGVLGMVELLRTSGLSDKQQRYAVSIRESGRVLLALINDLLDFSRIEAGRLELETTDFDLLKVLTEVRTLLSELASEKGLVLQVDTPPLTRLAVRGDPGRLRQVLLNLVGNA